MKKIVRLTESDLTRLVKKVIKEDEETFYDYRDMVEKLKKDFITEHTDLVADYLDKMEELKETIENIEELEEGEMDELTNELEHYINEIYHMARKMKKL